MDARNWRLLKIFAKNVAWLVACMVGMVSWVIILWWLPEPWGVVLGFTAPVLFLINICWEQAKYRLERQEYAEKRLADQLAKDD
jgi:membrane protein YdbS with pleckstrin-like domain